MSRDYIARIPALAQYKYESTTYGYTRTSYINISKDIVLTEVISTLYLRSKESVNFGRNGSEIVALISDVSQYYLCHFTFSFHSTCSVFIISCFCFKNEPRESKGVS